MPKALYGRRKGWPVTHWHGRGNSTLCGTWQAGDSKTSATSGPCTCSRCHDRQREALAAIEGMTLTVVDAPTVKGK